MKKVRENKTTRAKGITLNRNKTSYHARLVIKHPRKGAITFYIGSFDTIQEAILARRNWIESLI